MIANTPDASGEAQGATATQDRVVLGLKSCDRWDPLTSSFCTEGERQGLANTRRVHSTDGQPKALSPPLKEHHELQPASTTFRMPEGPGILAGPP